METREYLKQLRQDIVFSETLCGQHLTFHTTWGVFSPREIDEGSRLLLAEMRIDPNDDCLDLGCGYGPIGMVMARQAPQGQSLLVDKDFVAVDYANKNIQLNGIGNAQAILSNGFSAVGQRQFDVIASNIPAKVGNEMLTLFMHDALAHLNPGGRLYVVTINGLRQYIKRNFNEVFGNYDKLKQGRSYTVALAVKA
ncbi:MAG: methyltransferase [Chromatiales bacterium]|nr:class I SAM-dependent methyltransferase [Gammaproteobacteria bacterium]MBW6475631.1 methyltransferase [Chromatiales bacterium]